MSAATGVLVECPICHGCGMLTNSARDPQDHEDGECHACSGGGSVTREHHAELVDGMNDVAAIEALQRLADDDAAAREYAELQSERDREWWS